MTRLKMTLGTHLLLPRDLKFSLLASISLHESKTRRYIVYHGLFQMHDLRPVHLCDLPLISKRS